LTLVFNLKNSKGNPIPASPTDKIEVFFKDYKNKVHIQFQVVGSTTINMNIDNGYQ